ncbi:MAG: GIY-YIG nuclease family protein [Endomicrobiales bacterium]
MLDKKQLKEEYRSRVAEKGVFAIRNNGNGKVFLGGTMNLYNIAERSKFRLNTGSHQSEELQKDWKALGEAAFTIEILETLPLREDPLYDYDEDLKILEMIWVERFKPLAEKCYNRNENIRTI